MKQELEKFRQQATKKDKIILTILVALSVLIAPFAVREYYLWMTVTGYSSELSFVGMVFPCLAAFKVRSILGRK